MGLSNELSSEAGSFPAATSTPTGVFNQRFEALFPQDGALGYVVCFGPCPSSWFICARMWGRRVCQWSDCLRRLSHTPPVSVPPGQGKSSPPRCPSLPLLQIWMYVSFLSTWCRTSLPLDFLTVLVVQGGAVCLPTLPSWLSPKFNVFFNSNLFCKSLQKCLCNHWIVS